MPTDARPTLTRDVIVVGAVALADREGLGVLSMRRLADEVGYGTMSLYNHVEDKDDIHAGMVEHVLQDRTPLPGGKPWRPTLRHLAVDLRRVLGDHLWASQLWNRALPGPVRTQLMEDVLRTLRDGGFSPRMAHHAFHAIDLYVVGHAREEATFTIGMADPEATMQAFLDQTPIETFPYVVEHVDQHATGALADEDGFGFMLDLLLDGFERHLGED